MWVSYDIVIIMDDLGSNEPEMEWKDQNKLVQIMYMELTAQ